MKTIRRWDDLVPFGIEPLTGEACAFGVRILCDLSERGAATFRDLIGLPPGTSLAENMNSGRYNPNPSVASVMISRDALPGLATFCLLGDGATSVFVLKDGDIVGFYPSDAADEESLDTVEWLHKQDCIQRVYTSKTGPRVGSRMVHQFTGRVA